MKKMLICCAALCVTLTLFCAAALAANDLNVDNINVVNAESVNVTRKQDAADLTFTVTKTAGVQSGQLYLVLIQQGAGNENGGPSAPTEENIYYVDVREAEVREGAADPGLSLDACPKDGMTPGDYAVYLSDYSESANGAARRVATVTLSAANPGGGASGGTGEQAYTLGDVDGIDGIVPADALLTARIAANTLDNIQPWQRKAADVDGVDGVTPADALLILQKAAFPQKDFSEFMS